MIKPIGSPKPTLFKARQVAKKNTIETVEYTDGTHALIQTKTEGNKVKERTVTLYDNADTKVRTVVQIWHKKDKSKKLDKVV